MWPQIQEALPCGRQVRGKGERALRGRKSVCWPSSYAWKPEGGDEPLPIRPVALEGVAEPEVVGSTAARDPAQAEHDQMGQQQVAGESWPTGAAEGVEVRQQAQAGV